jgi:hypothetical protein
MVTHSASKQYKTPPTVGQVPVLERGTPISMSSEAENDRDAAVRQRKSSAKYAILCLAVMHNRNRSKGFANNDCYL